MIWYITAMLFLSQHMVNDLISPFSFPGHQTACVSHYVNKVTFGVCVVASLVYSNTETVLSPSSSCMVSRHFSVCRFNIVNLYVLNKSERKLNLCANENMVQHCGGWEKVPVCKQTRDFITSLSTTKSASSNWSIISLSVWYWHGWCVSSPNNGIDIRQSLFWE